MSRLLRTLLKITGALVALVLVIAVVLMLRIDPGQYRPAIEEAFNDATGLTLNIAGELELAYQPTLAVVLSDVRLRNPDRPQELASVSRVSLRVDPRQLLGGTLLLEELHAEGLHLNYYVDASGESPWLTERLRQRPTARNEGSGPIQVRLDLLSSTDTSIDIQNQQQGFYYSVRDLDLNSQNSNLVGQPFALQAEFEFIDPTAPRSWPMTLAATARLDRQQGAVSLTGFQLGLTPALLQGELQLRDLYGAGSWEAALTTSEFALDDLLANLLQPEATGQAPALPGAQRDPAWQTRWQASLNGDSQGIRVPELVATLGDMRLAMDADIRFANGLLPANARFSIETGALDLSPYLVSAEPDPPGGIAEPGPATDSAPPESLLDSLAIPDSLRAGMNVQGSVTLESLTLGGIQSGTVKLSSNLESGVLDVELQPTAVLEGTLEGHLRINTVPASSVVSTEIFASDIDLAGLDLPLLAPGTLIGRLSQESRYTGNGATLGDWLNTVSGATSFAVTDSTVDIGVIKQVFTAIAALSPRGEAIQTWPDAVPIRDFSGYVIAHNGLAAGQQVKVRMDNFDIMGSGGIDLTAGRFDYQLVFTVLGDAFLRSLPAIPIYQDISWPVQCGAGFEEPVNRFCRPDLTQAREIFNQLSNASLQYRLDEVLSEQQPPDLQNFTRGLLQQLFPTQELLPDPAELAAPEPDQDPTLPVSDPIPDQPAPTPPGGF